MGNTVNNNWPYPESSDLVKDGATAIENLADAIDTTLGVFVPSSPGLTLINTTSFSAVASQALPASTFTSTYRNYRIILSNITSSVDAAPFRMRYRASGSDTTSNTYFRYGSSSTSGSLTNYYEQNTSYYIANLSNQSAIPLFTVIDLSSIQTATRTMIAYYGLSPQNGSMFYAGGQQTDSTQFDSLNFFPDSGNISGTISVYGVNS